MINEYLYIYTINCLVSFKLKNNNKLSIRFILKLNRLDIIEITILINNNTHIIKII